MIKLETLDILKNIIDPDTYVIHKTGGYHIFESVKNAPQKYKDPIWPYVERIKEPFEIIKAGIHNINFYPRITLKENTLATNGKDYRRKKISMHQLVARVFVPNLEPLINVIVHHKNGDKCDFRPENLEWTTYEKNSIGVPGHLMRTPDQLWEIYNLVHGKRYEVEF